MGVAAVLPPSMGSHWFRGRASEEGGRAVLWLRLSAGGTGAFAAAPCFCGCRWLLGRRRRWRHVDVLVGRCGGLRALRCRRLGAALLGRRDCGGG
eukprot:scaffold12296_cov27-Tisochrysis_lutea.AAC.4